MGLYRNLADLQQSFEDVSCVDFPESSFKLCEGPTVSEKIVGFHDFSAEEIPDPRGGTVFQSRSKAD